jgi:hypothetical protein
MLSVIHLAFQPVRSEPTLTPRSKHLPDDDLMVLLFLHAVGDLGRNCIYQGTTALRVLILCMLLVKPNVAAAKLVIHANQM